MYWITVALFILLLITLVLFLRAKVYRQIFSIEHFREVYDGIYRQLKELKSAETLKSDEAGFLSSAGLLLLITAEDQGAGRRLHLSMSLSGRRMASSLASRIAFFFLVILDNSNAQLSATQNLQGVYQLSLELEDRKIAINYFDESFQAYIESYKAIHFETV